MIFRALFDIVKRNNIGKTEPVVKNERILSVPKGAFVICTNFHIVARVNRDIYKYDTGYATAFDYLDHQPVPIKGQMRDPTCYCGAKWFRNEGSKLIMKPVLMEKQ